MDRIEVWTDVITSVGVIMMTECTAMCRSLLSMPSSPSTVESCSMSSKPLYQIPA